MPIEFFKLFVRISEEVKIRIPNFYEGVGGLRICDETRSSIMSRLL